MKALLTSLGFCLFPALCCLAEEETSCSVDGTCSASGDDGFDVIHSYAQRQIDWLRENGGFVNEAYEIRRADPGDTNSRLGVFAKHDVQKSDLLLEIPRDLVVTSNEPDDECDTIRNLIHEMKLGDKSKFAPYINYLKTQMTPQLPGMWSDGGKQLLTLVLGQDKAGEPLLPPDKATSRDYFDCHLFSEDHEDRQTELYFAMLNHARGWDEVQLPVFDMLSHRNGQWLNTDSNSVHDQDENVKLTATKNIQQGEEIYTSYTHCRDCGARKTTYGTPSILRDYGFVEQMPQKWIFPDQHVSFLLDHKYQDDGTVVLDAVGNEVVELKWQNKPREHDDALDVIEFFEQQLGRLTKLQETKLLVRAETLPETEFDVIVSYVGAIMLAMKTFIAEIKKGDPGCLSGVGRCKINFRRYDMLNQKGIDSNEVLRPYSCDTDVSMDFTDYDNELESVQSHYQTINFFMHNQTKDCCFDLDDTYQICSSYRPQYHEMMLTYVARFLPSVSRILFAGGGDSMLLHEALKYKSLELVVGLELDQTVIRKSFKHFGTQPHFGDPRVEWWLGDASKSLLMLPRAFFGTFDLILVDMSETVTSNPVTDGVDVLGALSLLMKPNGILVKNELYLKEMSKLFKHSLQVHFYDNPVICSQCLILGSNQIDFRNATITDHKVETKFQALNDVGDTRTYIHSYIQNPNVKNECKKGKETVEGEQKRSPGIMMVLEAENALAELGHADIIKRDIMPKLKEMGLAVVSSTVSDIPGKGSIVTIIMHQGYVVARTKPESNFCAFDIHLWSAFQKQESIKLALLASVQSDPAFSSSFRIVAGGMFGVDGWQKDQEQRGPPSFSTDCKETEEPNEKPSESKAKTVIDSGSLSEILGGMLSLQPSGDTVALVVCGPKDTQCDSVGMVAKAVTTVVTAWSCPGMSDSASVKHEALQQKFDCEMELLSLIRESTTLNDGNKKVAVLVLDSSATLPMSQVVHKAVSKDLKVDPFQKVKIENIQNILNRGQHSNRVFADDILVLVPIEGKDALNKKWRMNFMHKFGTLYLKEPSARTHLLFSSADSNMELCLFRSGDSHFVEHLNHVIETIQEQTGLGVDVKSIEGGHPTYQHNFSPSFFAPSDYDQRGPYEQWSSQQPWGYHTIFQMESNSKPDANALMSLLDDVLSTMKVNFVSLPQKFLELGEGCMIVATFTTGNIVFLYDGRLHLDINLFLFEERGGAEFATELANQIIDQSQNPKLQIALKDEMPRRSINFQSDLQRFPPWAEHLRRD